MPSSLFSSKQRPNKSGYSYKRLLPANTALCSAQSGYTALVDEAGTVSSIKQAPIEKITPVLKQRGIQ